MESNIRISNVNYFIEKAKMAPHSANLCYMLVDI